jgi:acyl carrier protein
MNDNNTTDNKIHAAAALVAEILGVPQDTIGPDTSMENTPAWDSVEHLNILLEFERRFGKIPDLDAIANATSVREIAELIS